MVLPHRLSSTDRISENGHPEYEVFVTHPLDRQERSMFMGLEVISYQQWVGGAIIQNVLDYLTPDEREFLLSGTTPEMWNEMFPPEQEEEETDLWTL